MQKISNFQVFLGNCNLFVFVNISEVQVNQLSLEVGFLNKTSIIIRLIKKIMKTGNIVIEPYNVPHTEIEASLGLILYRLTQKPSLHLIAC